MPFLILSSLKNIIEPQKQQNFITKNVESVISYTKNVRVDNRAGHIAQLETNYTKIKGPNLNIQAFVYCTLDIAHARRHLEIIFFDTFRLNNLILKLNIFVIVLIID